MSRPPKKELLSFLSDLYGVELQALAQLTSAPNDAGDPNLAEHFRTHEKETESQAERVRSRLEALGGSPSRTKDLVMKLGGKGFLLFARLQTETPGRLAAHAYSFEAMEWAGYAVLEQMAERLGDATTAELARSIQGEEQRMMERIETSFAAVEEAVHGNLEPDETGTHVNRHLAEAHAIETQSLALLEKGAQRAHDPAVAEAYRVHLEQTRHQRAALEERLAARGGDTSSLEDAALKLGALNWDIFFHSQKDTPAKLAAFVFAVEHLEVAAYSLLRLTAQRARDKETADLCERILQEERTMADTLANSLGGAVDATLQRN